MNCVICGEPLTGPRHNPEPVKSWDEGRCCSTCNTTVVVPARIAKIIKESKR